MRIATWNVNSLKVRLPRLEQWLDYAKPDVLCLQETKIADNAFPAMDIERIGYEWVHHGNGRWNGVAILSKIGIADVIYGFDDEHQDDVSETRAISARVGPKGNEVLVTSVYVPNGRDLHNEMYIWKLNWLDRLHAFINRQSTPLDKAVICGDFNIAPEDKDVYDPRSFVGSTHVSAPERERLSNLTDWGLVDLFRVQYDDAKLYTWWDYRQGMFHKHKGMRIDLLLGTKPLADAVDFALVDRNARKGELPSDHAPTFVDLNEEVLFGSKSQQSDSDSDDDGDESEGI